MLALQLRRRLEERVKEGLEGRGGGISRGIEVRIEAEVASSKQKLLESSPEVSEKLPPKTVTTRKPSNRPRRAAPAARRPAICCQTLRL